MDKIAEGTDLVEHEFSQEAVVGALEVLEEGRQRETPFLSAGLGQ